MPETEREQEPRKRAGGYVSLLVSLIVGLVSAAVGFSLPIVFPGLLGHEPAEATSETLHTAFVPFGDIVVNLNEGRMNRYLRLSITLQVQGPEGIEETPAGISTGSRACCRSPFPRTHSVPGFREIIHEHISDTTTPCRS